MAILGTLIKNGIRIRESLEQEYASPYDLQKIELRKLLLTAANTSFGSRYLFKEILSSFQFEGKGHILFLFQDCQNRTG